MALQIRRAHRYFSSPQDQIALRSSNHASRGKVPGTLPMLLSIVAVLTTAFMVPGCAWVTHQPVKYYPYPSPPDLTSISNDRERREKIENYEKEYEQAQLRNYKEDKDHNGIRYYLSSPYLLVYTDGKGTLKWQIEHLPDQTKLMVGTPTQFFAKTTAHFILQNGVLTESKIDSDSTAALKAIIAAAEKVLPLALGLYAEPEDSKTRRIPAPRLYKIVVDKDNLTLIGVQNKEMVHVTLKPGSSR